MKLLRVVLMVFAFFLAGAPLFAQKDGFPPNKIERIIDLYLGIKNSLIDNDGTTAKIKANDLYQLLKGAPDKGLEWRQVEVLAHNLPTLMDNCREIGATVNESEQRMYLPGLTDGVYHLVKELRVNKKVLYRQYSPPNHAYWISETKQIKNPYLNPYARQYTANQGKTTEVLPRSILAD